MSSTANTLPAAAWAEADGTFTNAKYLVQRARNRLTDNIGIMRRGDGAGFGHGAHRIGPLLAPFRQQRARGHAFGIDHALIGECGAHNAGLVFGIFADRDHRGSDALLQAGALKAARLDMIVEFVARFPGAVVSLGSATVMSEGDRGDKFERAAEIYNRAAEIGRAGTLAAAARRLGVDQTTVARRLRALEALMHGAWYGDVVVARLRDAAVADLA